MQISEIICGYHWGTYRHKDRQPVRHIRYRFAFLHSYYCQAAARFLATNADAALRDSHSPKIHIHAHLTVPKKTRAVDR